MIDTRKVYSHEGLDFPDPPHDPDPMRHYPVEWRRREEEEMRQRRRWSMHGGMCQSGCGRWPSRGGSGAEAATAR
jgi:hypothetical protein